MLVDLNGKEPKFPNIESLLPEIPSQEDTSIEANFSRLLESLEIPEEENYVDSVLDGYERSDVSKVKLKKNQNIYIVNFTQTIGVGVYTSVGIQFVFDTKGNFDVQSVVGAGINVGENMSRTVSVGVLSVPKFEDASGFGTETGFGGGILGVVAGIIFTTAYDENGYIVGDGTMGYVGRSKVSPIFESHIGCTYEVSFSEFLEKMTAISKE